MNPREDDLEHIRRRLEADPAFRTSLQRDPVAALAEYSLDAEALAVVEELLRDHEVVGFQQLFPPEH